MLSPHGTWRSPLTSDLIVSQTIGLGSLTWAGDAVCWLEARPQEQGRHVLVKLSGATTQDCSDNLALPVSPSPCLSSQKNATCHELTPPPFNVRTRVHEYGGAAYLLAAETLYFIHDGDQRLYKQTPLAAPFPLTSPNNCRYADFVLDVKHQRLICVCEDHQTTEPENTLVAIDIETGVVTTLAQGHDFYSSPRLSPDGTTLAYLTWDHPFMPWDSSYLQVALINSDGSLGASLTIAGGIEESICEPRWSPGGILYFSSDRSGWWNLYRYSEGAVIPVYPLEAEFAYPHWVFGLANYGFINESELVCSYTQNGRWYLARLDIVKQSLELLDTPYTDISSVQVGGGKVYFIGGSPSQPSAVVELDLISKNLKILKKSSELELDSGYLSTPEAISFPTADGARAFAWYYPPQNKDYTGTDLPPLLVNSHGGPTAAASSNFNLRLQYWTSRGFAYLDVNYGGSTGYGRAYRQRLATNWGIVDVQDCIQGAQYLVREGRVDKQRLAISGGSAGGYTTLAALTFYDTFKAGASYYGISDLEALAQDTHKFESRYLEGLIGAYPQEQEIYYQRSPIHFSERLSCPIIFFQGLQDRVVPPNQAEMMVEVLRKKGLPVAYVAFAEEQHGFRRAENIKKALDGEFYFYAQVFGFLPADELEAIEIFNL
jgi:dipeptidyl aminopeptidase/acylaminoacyl peptidase